MTPTKTFFNRLESKVAVGFFVICTPGSLGAFDIGCLRCKAICLARTGRV